MSTRTIITSYQSAAPIRIVSTEMVGNVLPHRDWYRNLDISGAIEVEYNLRTVKCWKGKVDKVAVRMQTGSLERHIVFMRNHLPIDSVPDGPSLRQMKDEALAGYRQCSPSGYVVDDEGMTWSFSNYEPEDSILLRYIGNPFPAVLGDVNHFIDDVVGIDYNKSDIDDLRELLLARWGVDPSSKHIKEFVQNKTWYLTTPQLHTEVGTETIERKQIIEYLERLRDET